MIFNILGGGGMTQKETLNIIIKLREKGWSSDDIIAFLGFIETHNPTEEEIRKATEKQ